MSLAACSDDAHVERLVESCTENEVEHFMASPATREMGIPAPRLELKWTTSDFAVLLVRCLECAWIASLLSIFSKAPRALASRFRSSTYKYVRDLHGL